MTGIFIRRGKNKHPSRGRPSAKEAEIGVMHPQLKGCQGHLATTGSQEKARKDT
jgi:hypothetical protein